MNSIIFGLLGGFFVYLVFLSIQVIRLQKENDNFRSQIFSIRWNFLDLKDKVEHKKQQNDDSVIYSNDPNNYYVGDVIKFWNDNEDNPEYAMITALGAEYHLTFLSGTDQGKTSFHSTYDISTLIMDWHKYAKHIQRVRFYGTDLGRKVGNY